MNAMSELRYSGNTSGTRHATFDNSQIRNTLMVIYS
jgi:hypothetical protein